MGFTVIPHGCYVKLTHIGPAQHLNYKSSSRLTQFVNDHLYTFLFTMSTANGVSGTSKRDDSPPLTELETAEILQSIRNSITTTKPSSALPADLALSLDLHHQTRDQRPRPTDESPDPASYYWDASTMAPLNVVSAVSTHTSR